MISLAVGLEVVLISLLTALYLFSKYRKGNTLSRLDKASLVIGLIVDIVFFASLVIPNIPFVSEALGQIPLVVKWLIFAVTVTIAIVLAIILWRKSRNFLDPRFKGLQIFYSNKNDSPSTERPNRPYYVVNNATKQAYYVPDLIASYVRQYKIAWTAYDDKEDLHSYFDSQSINKNLRDPSDEELGLWLMSNRHLVVMERKLEPNVLAELKKRKAECKFKDYQIIYLYPWYCWFLRFRAVEDKAWPPNRIILADYSKIREAYGAPSETMHLLRENIISVDACTPRPNEDILKWCKRKRDLKYMYRTFIVEELLEEHPAL
jgi:hypothetical protein